MLMSHFFQKYTGYSNLLEAHEYHFEAALVYGVLCPLLRENTR